MTNLINTNIQTMSSKEIAELTGKNHGDVMRDCRKMFEELGIPEDSNIAFRERINSLGFTVKDKYYNLDKRLTYILITGYSIIIRAKVIDRWTELENEFNRNLLEEYGHTCKRLINRSDYDLYVVDFGEVRKVGISTNVEERVKHLELVGGRKALKVSTFSNIGGINAESRILKHFEDDRIIGEYLSTPMKDILLFISITFA